MAIAAGDRILASDILAEHTSAGAHTGEIVLVAGDLPAHGAAEHTDITRKLWAPFREGSGTRSSHGTYFAILLDAATETALVSIQVPDDFVSLGTVRVVLIPTTTGTFDWTCNTASGACGEDEALATDTDTADTQAATDDQILCLDVSSAFDGLSLAAGDFVGVEFVLDVLTTTTELLIVGLEFGYTANQ
jgi:hypothetical protein